MTLVGPLQPVASRCVPRSVASRAALVTVALVMAGVGTAAADPAFTWHAPASCPTADEVRARIEQRLGEPLEGAVHGIDIEIAREGTMFRARVDLRGMTVANDVRTLRATRCDELASGIAVIIARVATEARQTRDDDPTASEAPPDAAGEATDLAIESFDTQLTEDRDDLARAPHPVDHRLPPPPGHRWGGGMRALGLSGVGAQPGVSIGGEIAAYVRRNKATFEAAYATWSATPAVLRNGAPGHVNVGLDVLIARAGWGPEELPLRAWVSGELGSLHGQGVSLQDPRMGSGRWVALGSGFAVGWPVTTYARVIGMFEVAFPIASTRFQLASGSDAYRPALLTARCALGFEVGWR